MSTQAHRKAAQAYYERNREKVIANSAARQKANWPQEQVAARRRHLRNAYRITPEQYDAMLEAQNGHCAICPATAPGRGQKHFIVDHDHVTGEVRGLLCHRCNAALGMMEDNVERVEAAAKYLKDPPARRVLNAA